MPPSDPVLPWAPMRLLLVEDNAEGRAALAKVLELRGFDVTAVADGVSALEVLATSPPPDVLLVDLMLPDMDGLEVCRRTLGLVPRPFVALVTGWSFEADIREIASSGIDHVLLKPLDVREFVELLHARRARGKPS